MTNEEREALKAKMAEKLDKNNDTDMSEYVSPKKHARRIALLVSFSIVTALCIVIYAYVGSVSSGMVRNDDSTKEVVESIPYSGLEYDGESFSLTNVGIYDSYSDYEHTLCVIVDFDFSTLSEESIHWMMKEDDTGWDDAFDVDVYVDSPSNGIDFESMTNFYTLYSSEETYCGFLLSGARNDFGDAELTISVDIKQPDVYSDDGEAVSTTNSYMLYVDGDNGIYVPVHDESHMSVEHALFMEKATEVWKQKSEAAQYGYY